MLYATLQLQLSKLSLVLLLLSTSVSNSPFLSDFPRVITQPPIIATRISEDSPQKGVSGLGVWDGYSTLKRILSCETTGKPNNEPTHYKNGTVIFHRNKDGSIDFGVGQINDSRHLIEAQKMGYDLMDYEDNLNFAKYLYDKNGVRDYSASKGCWNV